MTAAQPYLYLIPCPPPGHSQVMLSHGQFICEENGRGCSTNLLTISRHYSASCAEVRHDA